MKKNNKGFFLAETIVVIALVTTVMAFVYPNVTKLYENYKNRANYYDQTEDLYALKAVYNLFENDTINFVDPPANSPDDIDANNVKSVSILGFLTFEGKNFGSRSSSAGCLRIDELNKIYYPESKNNYVGTTNLIGIGTGLDKIRRNNVVDFNNEYDYFTCFGDFYGIYGSYNLDTNGGAGLVCNMTKKKYNDFFDKIQLKELYITGYMSTPSSDNYNFNKYLKRLKKTNYDSAAYRLIGVFEKKDAHGNIIETRYASIKVDNPNPNRNCNLGG